MCLPNARPLCSGPHALSIGLEVKLLSGVRVVDLTRVLSGPFGSTILGDLGAEVIKVEDPRHGDPVRNIGPYVSGQSHYFLSLNRNKKSLALDIKSAEGRVVLRRLLATADVLIENFRPGVLANLGLDPDDLGREFPELIICSISGYGQTGPMRRSPSFDVVTQALAGMMSVTGEPGRPPVRLGIPMGDLIGGLYGAIAVCAALHARDSSGSGAHIDLALFDGLASLLGYMVGRYFATGEVLGPVGSGHHTSVPYGAFEASDGYVVVACMTDTFWPRICDSLGLSEMATDSRFATYDNRHENREMVNDAVGAVIATKTVDEWCDIFEAADIPYGPILDIAGVVDHPQIRHRNMITEVHHPVYGSFKTLGFPVKLAGEADDPLAPPPLLGEDSERILTELGYSPEEFRDLEDSGIVSAFGKET